MRQNRANLADIIFNAPGPFSVLHQLVFILEPRVGVSGKHLDGLIVGVARIRLVGHGSLRCKG